MSKEQINNKVLKSDLKFIKDFLEEECGKIAEQSIMWYCFDDLEKALEDLDAYKKALEKSCKEIKGKDSGLGTIYLREHYSSFIELEKYFLDQARKELSNDR